MTVAEGNVGLAFGLVIAAGLSTTVGSAFVFCSDYANTKALAAALGVSAGVMLYVSFVEIFSIKAVEALTARYPDAGSKWATLCFFSGICATYVLDALVHKIGDWQKRSTGAAKAEAICVCFTNPADMLAGERSMWSDAAAATNPGDVVAGEEHPESSSLPQAKGAGSKDTLGGHLMEEGRGAAAAEDDDVDRAKPPPPPAAKSMKRNESEVGLSSISHDVTDEFDTPDKKRLKNMGLMTGLAIGLHNFPEGLATFVAALADAKLGIALAVAIAVHNIPEGVCVAMPVYYATGSKWKGFFWSFVSGLSEPIGGLFGYLILYSNAMSDEAYGALFGVVGGMMVYISLKELLPTALKYDPHDQYVTNCMFLGMAVMALSLILFQI